MKIAIYLFGILTLIWSCSPNGIQPDPLVFTRDSIVAQSDACGRDSAFCTTASLLLPVAYGGRAGASDRINDTLEYYSSQLIGFGEKGTDLVDPRLAVNQFVAEYDTFLKASTEEYTVSWYCKQVGELLYEGDSLVSVRINNDSYSGGAHGNSVTVLFTFRVRDGRALTYKDILQDTVTFTQIAERHFRMSRGLLTTKDLYEAGFFWEGKFELPKNFACTQDGILLHYNAYEVAPYALGPTEFTIPYQELQGVFKDSNWFPKS